MYLVAIGTVVGHAICTAGAVIAGRYISTKIDVKYGMRMVGSCAFHWSNASYLVTLAGAALFILFGFIYTYEFFVDITAAPSPEN